MRPLPLMLLSCLLLGCASQPADEVSQPASAAKPAIQAVQTAAKNMHNQRQLSGTLMTPPAGSRVELAVLLIDAQGYPRKLLGSGALTGTGQALPFTVVFARPAATSDLQLQLRARVRILPCVHCPRCYSAACCWVAPASQPMRCRSLRLRQSPRFRHRESTRQPEPAVATTARRCTAERAQPAGQSYPPVAD